MPVVKAEYICVATSYVITSQFMKTAKMKSELIQILMEFES